MLIFIGTCLNIFSRHYSSKELSFSRKSIMSIVTPFGHDVILDHDNFFEGIVDACKIAKVHPGGETEIRTRYDDGTGLYGYP